jgi:hypothetical protein
MAATHSHFQGFELSFPAGNAPESVRFGNPFMTTLSAADSQAEIREGVIELFNRCRHTHEFAGRRRQRPSSKERTVLLDES